ncbi:hypothetical protein [Catenulispora yoronensis]|uniref:hypothetical protein n=1 Tax=Catenulispora yoronensis TaxID=450799 RepID=UPI0031CEF122
MAAPIATVTGRAVAAEDRYHRRARMAVGIGVVVAAVFGALLIGPIFGRWPASDHVRQPAIAAGGRAESALDARLQALARVEGELKAAHAGATTGVGVPGIDYATGVQSPVSDADQLTVIVYRVPGRDSTLERDAEAAARPFYVVFRDSVLNAAEVSALGARLAADRDFWQKQGLDFVGRVEVDGTITISCHDPGRVVPAVERYYGYDGRVFVGN